MKFQCTSLALFLLASSVAGVTYKPAPETKWAGSVGSPIEIGNSVTVTPDDSHVAITTSSANMYVHSAADGALVTTITPADVGLPADTVCSSGVEFFEYDGTTYAVYAVFHEPTNLSYIIFASGEGFATAVASNAMQGKAAGTPVVSSDGALVYINSNVGNNEGHFNIFSTSTKVILFNDPNAWASTRAVQDRFAPLGIYHNPSEGYYNIDNQSGVGNTNDIIFWANDLPLDAAGNEGGARYVFQVPIGWSDGDSAEDFDVLAAQVNGWSTETAPALWNQGKNAIFGTTRNSFKAWVQFGGDDPKWQDGANAQVDATTDGRGFPRWSAPRTTPVVTDDDGSGYIVAGLAGAGANSPALHVLKASDLEIIYTEYVGGSITEAVYAQPVLSLDKDVAFWMSSGENILYATDLPPGDITGVGNRYSVTLTDLDKVQGHMSLSSDGVYLYIGDTDGTVGKYAIAEEGTSAPVTAPPTMMASDAPTMAPIVSTPAPSISAKPSVTASEAPTSSPTESSAPTVTATDPPTVKSSEAPSTPPTTAPVTPAPVTPAPVAATPEPTEAPTVSPTEESEAPTAPSSSAAMSTMFTLCAAVAAALYL
jgi:hypothetical protein